MHFLTIPYFSILKLSYYREFSFRTQKMWQHHAKKRQTNLPCRNRSICSGGCSISVKNYLTAFKVCRGRELIGSRPPFPSIKSNYLTSIFVHSHDKIQSCRPNESASSRLCKTACTGQWIVFCSKKPIKHIVFVLIGRQNIVWKVKQNGFTCYSVLLDRYYK